MRQPSIGPASDSLSVSYTHLDVYKRQAVLVEVAIRNHMLLLRGINATKQFTQRQQREMKKSNLSD